VEQRGKKMEFVLGVKKGGGTRKKKGRGSQSQVLTKDQAGGVEGKRQLFCMGNI